LLLLFAGVTAAAFVKPVAGILAVVAGFKFLMRSLAGHPAIAGVPGVVSVPTVALGTPVTGVPALAGVHADRGVPI
jgi:hypothetical protein